MLDTYSNGSKFSSYTYNAEPVAAGFCSGP